MCHAPGFCFFLGGGIRCVGADVLTFAPMSVFIESIMNTKLIAIIAAAVLIAGGLIFAFRGSGVQTAVAAPARPWLEVSVAPVYERDRTTQKENVRELFTGDELSAGLVIGVPEGSRAALHFPDGSVARIDSDTALVVNEAQFSRDTDTLSVSLDLSWGRIWSKIFELATPESHWEVKTTNAVAVVRGTAFGVEYAGTASSIIGSKNSVSIAARDPDTGETIAGSETQVAEDQFVHIEKKDIPAIKSGKISLTATVTAPPKEVQEAVWIIRAKEEDRRFDEKVEALRAQAGTGASAGTADKEALRKALRAEINKEFDQARKQREEREKTAEPGGTAVSKEETSDKKAQGGTEKNTAPAQLQSVKQSVETKAVQKDTDTSPASRDVSGTALGALSRDEARPTELIIKSIVRPGFRISEGEPLRLAAQLVLRDGSTRDVTREALWQVLGGIGSIKEPGVFVGKLSSSLAEFGHAPGNIIATWKDPKNPGNVLFDKTPVFEVDFKVLDSTDTRG